MYFDYVSSKKSWRRNPALIGKHIFVCLRYLSYVDGLECAKSSKAGFSGGLIDGEDNDIAIQFYFFDGFQSEIRHAQRLADNGIMSAPIDLVAMLYMYCFFI